MGDLVELVSAVYLNWSKFNGDLSLMPVSVGMVWGKLASIYFVAHGYVFEFTGGYIL